jgi:hypothetical protein
MRNNALMKPLLAGLILSLSGLAAAQDGPSAGDSSPNGQTKAEAPAKLKAYDALYSDIIRTLPQEGKSKVDSARGRERRPETNPDKRKPDPEEIKREALEKRKKELDDLPPDVKARVDKVLSDLDSRRREKQTEFKELKE